MKNISDLLKATLALLLCLPSVLPADEPGHAVTAQKVLPAKALERLKAGNGRFAANKVEHPHQSAGRRAELATSQSPFAIVLGCADSRTSPEVVFDHGLGDLFVLRVAGNVLNDETLGSIEYAVEHLGAQLIVVLGHERCGAVDAARKTLAAKTQAPGHIQSLVTAIEPAVTATFGADAETTGKTNGLNVAQALRDSTPILKEKFVAGALSVVAAHYDLDTGVVEFLNEREAQARKLKDAIAGTTWVYHWHGEDFQFSFDLSGETRILPTWAGVKWRIISPTEVVLDAPSGDVMILRFAPDLKSFQTEDWDNQPGTGKPA